MSLPSTPRGTRSVEPSAVTRREVMSDCVRSSRVILSRGRTALGESVRTNSSAQGFSNETSVSVPRLDHDFDGCWSGGGAVARQLVVHDTCKTVVESAELDLWASVDDAVCADRNKRLARLARGRICAGSPSARALRGAVDLQLWLDWVMIGAMIVRFARHDRVASALLVPYAMWVSFAMMLNAALWQLNS
jgi:TspO/MBR family